MVDTKTILLYKSTGKEKHEEQLIRKINVWSGFKPDKKWLKSVDQQATHWRVSN